MGTARRFRTVILAALLVVGVAACGGDDSSDDEGSGADGSADAGASDDSSDEGTDDDSGDGDSDGGDSGGGGGAIGATVTVGGETYEATTPLVCVTMGGAMNASFTDDSGEVEISVDMPPVDWEDDTQSDWSPPYVRVDDDRQDPIKQWESGGDDQLANAPETSIGDYSVDGGTTSGSGTFVDVYAVIGGEDPEVVEGTFEATCE